MMRWKALTLTLLALALCLGAMAAGAEEVYMSLFDSGYDGWYARSTGSATLEASSGSLVITGRSQDWHSPGRDFNLAPGQQYELGVQVFQDRQPSATFLISIAHTKNGRETYENLGRGEAKQGEWTGISGSYLAGDYDKSVLYVETLGAPELSFRIKAFSVLAPRMERATGLPALKDLYRDYFDFGCAVTYREAVNTQLMDFYASQFSIMTHGNELKPDSVLDVPASALLSREDPGAVAIRLDAARPLMDYAAKNGIKVHGHVLVWHSQTPDAFFRERYSPTGPYVSREVMLSRLDNYIRLVFERTQAEYPGLIVSWDVVNEAVDDSSGQLRASNWTRVLGEDFVLQAFRLARKYAPEGTQLYYNDYSTPYQPKLNGILKLLGELKEENLVDGHGFQCHYHLHTPGLDQLQSAMDKVLALGLRLRMSEMDILVDSASEENFKRQASRYGDFLALFRQYHGQIDAVHTWGVTDNLSWKAGNFPLLFDGRGLPKPAFFAITDPLLP